MKNLFVVLMALLMSMNLSTFASTTTVKSNKVDLSTFIIPSNIKVKQTITFDDGKTICLYYQKAGEVCKLFSTVDINKYKESDLAHVRSTNFEIVDKVEGKCYITCKTNDVITFAKSIINQILL